MLAKRQINWMTSFAPQRDLLNVLKKTTIEKKYLHGRCHDDNRKHLLNHDAMRTFFAKNKDYKFFGRT
jgi:hypothetical protein